MISDDPKVMVGELNMTDERDRGRIRLAAGGTAASKRKRWDVDDAIKAEAIKTLRYAMTLAIKAEDHRGMRGIVETLAVLEGQNQSDEHLADKNARLDSGQSTENVQHVRRVILELPGEVKP